MATNTTAVAVRFFSFFHPEVHSLNYKTVSQGMYGRISGVTCSGRLLPKLLKFCIY